MKTKTPLSRFSMVLVLSLLISGCSSPSKASANFKEVCEIWFSTKINFSYESTTSVFTTEIEEASKVDPDGSKQFVETLKIMQEILILESGDVDEREQRIANQNKKKVDENLRQICKPYCEDCLLF